MLCDPIWHVSSRSGVASCELLYSVYLYLTLPCDAGKRRSCTSDYWQIAFLHLSVRKNAQDRQAVGCDTMCLLYLIINYLFRECCSRGRFQPYDCVMAEI